MSHVANVTRNGGSEWKLSDESTHEHGQGLEEVYPGPAKSKAILRHLTPACSLVSVGRARNKAAAGSVVVLGLSESEQATGGRSAGHSRVPGAQGLPPLSQRLMKGIYSRTQRVTEVNFS